MHLVEALLNTAVADNRLLIQNQQMGDRAEIPRDVDFVLYTKDEERAKLVASFITDNRYGRPSVQRVEHQGKIAWRLLVVVHTPTTENVLHTLSAFMLCLAHLYDLDYDGWGSTIHK